MTGTISFGCSGGEYSAPCLILQSNCQRHGCFHILRINSLKILAHSLELSCHLLQPQQPTFNNENTFKKAVKWVVHSPDGDISDCMSVFGTGAEPQMIPDALPFVFEWLRTGISCATLEGRCYFAPDEQVSTFSACVNDSMLNVLKSPG